MKPAKFHLSKYNSQTLLFVQFISLSALSFQFAWWFILLTACCFLWQISQLTQLSRQGEIPPVFLKLLIIGVGCIGLTIGANTAGLLLTMVQLLAFTYLMKPFEIRQRRDLYQVVLLGLLLLACSLIFYQSIAFTLIVFVLMALNISVLVRYFDRESRFIKSFRLSGKLIAQSLPLAIVLFVFFPKLPPFWQVPLAKTATTGLSDSVTIGDIANLALSNELAFRVEFETKPLQYHDLYWRTLVLEHFDGSHWRRTLNSSLGNHLYKNSLPIRSQPDSLVEKNKVLSYQVYIEASFQHWLPALDLATIAGLAQTSTIYPLKDFTLYRKRKVTQTTRYHVKSILESQLAVNAPKTELMVNTVIPDHSNPQLTAYAHELRETYLDDRQLINHVLSKFNQENYHYTLRPPALENNSLDQFYFETKAGFCEHYASSFTYLMRAVGIPSRLVLGYLGGELNESGNYYNIYQRDAHAWSEVWLAGQGWVRIDPTASVNPQRVEQGLSEQLLREQQSLNNHLFDFDGVASSTFFQYFRSQIDMIDHQWTKWVIGYSQDKQISLLKRLFNKEYQLKSGIVICLTLTGVFILLWFVNKKRKNQADQPIWCKQYQQVLVYLMKKGIEKPKGMHLSDFNNLINEKHKEIAPAFNAFITQFIKLQYENLSTEARELAIQNLAINLKTFKHCCKQYSVRFKPKTD